MEQLNQLLEDRKWYNAYLYLNSLDESQYTEKLVDSFLNKTIPLASQLYPLSLTQTVIKVTKKYSQRLDALIELESKIEESIFKEKAHKDSLILLKIAITEMFFETNKNIESQIYELKAMDLNQEQQQAFDHLALRYFEKCGNSDEAYLCSKRLNFSEKMAENALHARNVFFLPELDEKESALYKAVREGNYSYVLKSKTENLDFILEKTYIIKMLDICRNQKEIDLIKLGKDLNLEQNSLLLLLIKAIGLNIIDGKINGVKNLLEIFNVNLQTVAKADLTEIKEQFEAWRDRVDEIIRVME
ncbi:26S proteasome regulatory complex, subunit RPN9/PSMD13 [Pseudoloma neurophilia]|uniref:26S proteasome regulatory complex, subunit RPN9/PSMD13 n=1 Tax=Pseudoloma neurophilia TaxID=146866 RepID=A0A0R0M3P8_9MICR|nr:26S proteasome regulatory complex, subunit RPN9/PSMD13 [Pseudoloma neurophilia]